MNAIDFIDNMHIFAHTKSAKSIFSSSARLYFCKQVPIKKR
ncbi:hypothetical protein BREVNS_1293 [Brevinematales bacterium NS]|nr:hypothetical protein BREVNS_1293 [Brevinematales bacterium NS]